MAAFWLAPLFSFINILLILVIVVVIFKVVKKYLEK